MNLERVVFGSAAAMFGAVAWLKVRNGALGTKYIHLTNGFRRQYEVFAFEDSEFSLFPHKAMIIETTNVPELMRMKLQFPLDDWRKWSGLFKVRVVSSVRPLKVDVHKLAGEKCYMELLTLELERTPLANDSSVQTEKAIAEWAKTHGTNHIGWMD
jgi:hypothetical protein